MFNKNKTWVPAADPLHFDKPSIVGVGLGKSFGIKIADQEPGVTIGLIPCAVGGSPIQSWEPGGYHPSTKTHPWDDMQVRAKEALKKEPSRESSGTRENPIPSRNLPRTTKNDYMI